MIEKIQTIEQPLPRRLEYGAVPLNAWNACDTDGDEKLSYALASIHRITAKSKEAMQMALDHGWVPQKIDDNEETLHLSDALGELIEMSLYDSHMQRIDRNSAIGALANPNNDPRIEHAMMGRATPGELLSLLRDYPELGSIELAKLSHPLDSAAVGPMDKDVYDTLVQQWGELSPEAPCYKTKTMVVDIPATTVLRKQVVGSYDTPGGTIAVMRRQAFLVRGDDEAKASADDPYLDRKVRNRSRHEEIFPEIEQALPLLDEEPYVKWLQPLATSYYAKNLSTSVKHRSAH